MPKEVNGGQRLEHDHRADGLVLIDLLGHLPGHAALVQLIDQEGLLIDQVAEHKGAAGIGKLEERVDLVADAAKEEPTVLTAEDEEAEEELEAEAPDHLAPHHAPSALREDVADADDKDEATSGYESAGSKFHKLSSRFFFKCIFLNTIFPMCLVSKMYI